ncbi:unnamed protein product [Ixodes pacificus]
MFTKVVLCSFFAYVMTQVTVEHPPQPYNFGFDNTDEFGTRLVRQETGDKDNTKIGSYSYTDAYGITRTVKYVADADGFRATVETNEPGTKTSSPADTEIVAAASPVVVRSPPVVHKDIQTPVVVKAAHPTRYAVHAVHATPAFQNMHPRPAVYTDHTAPVIYTTHHQTPVTYTFAQAPLAYTLSQTKST